MARGIVFNMLGMLVPDFTESFYSCVITSNENMNSRDLRILPSQTLVKCALLNERLFWSV